jgi:2,4-dienoyl-CoA reductase-like NADH-dependent reductase (Old Yellow Enzyme family)
MAPDPTDSYPHLFSPWDIRRTTVPNRVVFAPTCPVWVRSPYEGSFTEQAVAYYEERARGGVGMIIIGGTLINEDSIYSPFLFPGLWDDDQIQGLAAVAHAVHRHGCKLAVQLLHVGLRASTAFKTDPAYDPDATWYMVAPSQVPPAEYPGAMMPKELEEHEIEQILCDYESAAGRAIEAGLDGVEFHMAHGYLPWQFLSPLYNHREDRWGGSYENRLRFPVEAMRRIRRGIGDDNFMGYRINSTSFWEGDLELEDVKDVVKSFDVAVDADYVSLSAGVHHSYIHTPMTYKGGWEREYTRAVKTVTDKPVLLVGRVTTPAVAEELLASGDADAILLGRQLFADAEWVAKAKDGREEDIRRCVAANYCWRSVTRGGRVQCVYNPEVGREAAWGSAAPPTAHQSKKVLIVGAGPSGLEYARVAAARGHEVVVYERDDTVGGHTRAYGALPHRTEYGWIGTWLAEQARKNGSTISTSTEITEVNVDSILARERPDHVVVATGARVCRRLPGANQRTAPGLRIGKLRSVGRGRDGKGRPLRRGTGDRRHTRQRSAVDCVEDRGNRSDGPYPDEVAHDRDGHDTRRLCALDAHVRVPGGHRNGVRPLRKSNRWVSGQYVQRVQPDRCARVSRRLDRHGHGPEVPQCAVSPTACERDQRRVHWRRDGAAGNLRGDV